jgi:hypothetical protein
MSEIAPEPSATTPADAPIRFDTRVVVALRDDLLPWQELNVTAFLMTGIAISAPDLTGEPYRDRDGTTYLPMLRQPVMVLSANAAQLATARAKAVDRDMAIAVYTYEMFSTSHDAANRAAVATVAANDLDLVGIALRGPRNAVDRIVKGMPKHP